MRQIDLSGRIALVTGAGRGIGLATTTRLVAAGATVIANIRERTPDVASALNLILEEYPGQLVIYEGSVSDDGFHSDLARYIFGKYKKLDILVNNAGILRDAYIGMIDKQTIDLVISTNLVSVINLIQASSRLLRRSDSGSIINLASIVGRRGNEGQLVYGASKAGVIGVTLSAAKELASAGVRVNAVAPGLIETRMTARLPAETKALLGSKIAMRRSGVPDDVADVILFLASDLSRYVTGQVIGVDGGLAL